MGHGQSSACGHCQGFVTAMHLNGVIVVNVYNKFGGHCWYYWVFPLPTRTAFNEWKRDRKNCRMFSSSMHDRYDMLSGFDNSFCTFKGFVNNSSFWLDMIVGSLLEKNLHFVNFNLFTCWDQFYASDSSSFFSSSSFVKDLHIYKYILTSQYGKTKNSSS